MKFKFIGFGGRKPYDGDGDYNDFNPDTEYWYSSSCDFTVGKVYETEKILTYESGLPDDAFFTDDEGIQMIQELQFFEEVTE